MTHLVNPCPLHCEYDAEDCTRCQNEGRQDSRASLSRDRAELIALLQRINIEDMDDYRDAEALLARMGVELE